MYGSPARPFNNPIIERPEMPRDKRTLAAPHPAVNAPADCLLCQIMRETNTDLWIIGDLPRAVYDQQYRAPAATTVDTGILGRRSHSGFRC